MFTTNLVVDINTLHKLSLERFSRVKPNVWTCRCPVCGDSKKRKYITRFYFYVKKGQLNTCCHNCGYSRSFFNFIKEHVQYLFPEYKKETLLSSFTTNRLVETETETKPLSDITTSAPDIMSFIGSVQLCDDLSVNHPARRYLENRGIKIPHLQQLWYADNFYEVAKIVDPALPESSEFKMKSPRIVIPFLSEDGSMVEMVQGRSIDPDEKLRYISIKSSDAVEKIYGKHTIDYSKPVHVVEGPFDSLFVHNCVASCDANLTRIEADVYIWDNQPRNKEVINYLDDAIDSGKSVVIWPTSPSKKQDINDLILTGLSQAQVNQIISKHTFKGIKAKMELMKWKRL